MVTPMKIANFISKQNQKHPRRMDCDGDVFVLAVYGINNNCPTLILLMFVILLREAIAATVVPYLMAITVRVSPGFTACVLCVGEELLSAGIATATGTVN